MTPYEIRNMSMLDMEYKECIDAEEEKQLAEAKGQLSLF